MRGWAGDKRALERPGWRRQGVLAGLGWSRALAVG